MNAAAAYFFGMPLFCLTMLVIIYHVFWGAGGELTMLGLIVAGVAAVCTLARFRHGALIETMSVRIIPADDPS